VTTLELAVPGLPSSVSFHIHDPETDLVSRRMAEERCWEVFESRLWLASQRAGDVVVDAGANLGYFALLSALAPARAGQIHAFEPAADNFELLESNLALNRCAACVRAHRLALGARHARGSLYRSADNRGDHQVYAGDGERLAEDIETVEGARYLARFCDRIDLLKVDTQGSEFSVIEGLWPLLVAGGSELRMLIELTPFSLQLAGASGRALIERLSELDLPMSIVDHIEGRLEACAAEDLAQWCDNVAATRGDRGFMNIFLGTPPRL
jgi:FkbM family methyltransferase